MPGYIAESDNCSIHRRFTSVHISGSKVAEWTERLNKVIVTSRLAPTAWVRTVLQDKI